MIKLTEIITNAGNYDPQSKNIKRTYSLRSLYINPEFIISMLDNKTLNDAHEQRPIISDLHSAARFTKLSLAGSQFGAAHYDILGAPEKIHALLTEE